MSNAEQFSEYLQSQAAGVNERMRKTLSNMTARDYIRLVIIIGAYALLRPYLMKLGARLQAKQHERQGGETEKGEEESTASAQQNKISANELRTGRSDGARVQIPGGDSESSGSEDEGRRSTDWGKTARRRQRRVLKTLLEQEARRKEEEETASDEEIRRYLVD